MSLTKGGREQAVLLMLFPVTSQGVERPNHVCDFVEADQVVLLCVACVQFTLGDKRDSISIIGHLMRSVKVLY